MEQQTDYLKRLKFEEKLSFSWIAKYLSNPRLLFLILLSVILLGITSFINLPRNLNPEVNIPIVIVNTVLPGASPTDVESLITIPVEDAVRGLEGVDQVTSSSRESVSTVTLEFRSGIDPDDAKDDVQSAIDGVNDLPEDATTPRVAKIDFERTPVWSFSLTGKDSASLMRFAQNLKDELEAIPLIDEVAVSGLEIEEIQILVNSQVVSSYSLNPQQLAGSIQSALSSFPAGTLRTDGAVFTLSIDPTVTNIEEIRNVIVNLQGTTVKLSDIAEVTQRPKPEQFQSFYASKEITTQQAVTFDIYRRNTASIEQTAQSAEERVETTLENQGNGFTVHTLTNVSEEITDQFQELTRDFLITVVLVFIVLFLFLGIRPALVSLLSAPLTFFITFTVMQVTGLSLNFLAFFSLLLSLGLLVDDTIVVISAMTAYYRSGKFTPFQTALLVWRDFLIPIFTTTLTTVWAFLPLLLSTGIIGEFIKPIPIIVSTTLIASFFIAMFITLPLMIILLKPSIPHRVSVLMRLLGIIIPVILLVVLLPKDNPIFLAQLLVLCILIFVFIRVKKILFQGIRNIFGKIFKKRNSYLNNNLSHGVVKFSVVDTKYRKTIERILVSKSNRRKTVFLVLVFFIFAFMLVPLGFVKNEFFPASDSDYLYMSLELPSGTYTSVTKQEALEVLESIKNTNHLQFATVDIGRGIDVNSGGFSASGANTALYTLHLTKQHERNTDSGEIAQQLREQFKTYSNGIVTVQEISGGPPAGADLQIRLLGDDLGELDIYANKIQEFLESNPGVTNVTKSVKPGTSKLVFTPDTQKLAQLGIDKSQIGFWLRTYASGFEVDSLRLPGDGNDLTDITIRMSPTTQTADSLSTLVIPTQQGTVPLLSLGKINLEQNPTVINRDDGKRTLSISAGVAQGFNIAELNTKLEQYADSLQLPTGYSWETGGVNEENQRSVNSILQAMVFSFLLIILTMVIQFSSFRRALIVMLVIPLSISGVFIIFALLQIPLSFPALIGLLALFGIVVKNSILIVDKITANREIGMNLKDSIADASQSRLEAITLTSLCTIVGLIPIMVSDPLWRGLGGAIIAGLTFSGTIMLFFIPVVYYMWFQEEEHRKR